MYISRAKKGAQIRQAQDQEDKRRAKAWAKIAKEEQDAKDPSMIRNRIKRECRQSLNNIYKQNIEIMYEQTLVAIDNLINLILKDLDLINNPEKELTLSEILSVMDYYKTNIKQLSSIINDAVMEEYMKTKLSPTDAFYKKLIAVKMDFCVAAPASCLKINYNYNKVKNPETREYMLKHLVECGFFRDYKIREKFSKLYNEYLALNLSV